MAVVGGHGVGDGGIAARDVDYDNNCAGKLASCPTLKHQKDIRRTAYAVTCAIASAVRGGMLPAESL